LSASRRQHLSENQFIYLFFAKIAVLQQVPHRYGPQLNR
jgi:hypothetical protein